MVERFQHPQSVSLPTVYVYTKDGPTQQKADKGKSKEKTTEKYKTDGEPQATENKVGKSNKERWENMDLNTQERSANEIQV